MNRRSRGHPGRRVAVVLALLVGGAVLVAFGNLALTSFRLGQEAAALRQEVEQARAGAAELEGQAEYLRSDRGLEALAREQGYVRKGEMAEVVVEDKAATASIPALSDRPSPPAAIWQRWWHLLFE